MEIHKENAIETNWVKEIVGYVCVTLSELRIQAFTVF